MQEVLDKFRSTRLLVLEDDSSDTGRSIFVAPAAAVDAALVNRVTLLSGGLISVAVSAARAAAFALERMGRSRTSAGAALGEGAAGCVSVEAREGVTTGISAADRAATVHILGSETPQSRQLVKPGHVFPVEVRAGGILVRNALPEGALDVVTICGFTDAAMYLDILDEKGEFLSRKRVRALAEREKLPILSLSELTRHRLAHEKLVYRVAEAKLPTTLAGEVRSCIYRSTVHDGEHVALVKGVIDPNIPTLTRVQPEFTFADVFGGGTPPSRALLRQSLAAIGANGSGVLIYLRRPVSGQLTSQVEGATQEKPAAMMREYGLGAQILRDLGVRKIELLTSGRKDLAGLSAFGLEIVGQRPIPMEKGEVSR